MLINRKQEGGGGRAVKNEVPGDEEGGHSHEYQSADELYEILAKNHPFNADDKKSLTTQDLVLLYKNIDIGTKLLSNNGYDINNKKPNQYVESVVYNDDRDSDGSDVSEMYSNEDISNVFMINSERMDFFNMQSYDNTLCQKLGNINMKSSKLSTEYDKHFLFNDPYVKEQLKSFHAISKSKHSDSSVLTTSLLDYICCKRLEDNYNFYMDNVIQYVKHTIDQLRRISNGDYLTDRVKEKWKGVCDQQNNDCKMSILKTTNSIHHHADNFNENKSMWDGIVHSEIDVRTMSKILEKKIVVEVPKLLSGSFKLFSKCYKNKLYIRYKKDKQTRKEKRDNSQVDVVLKLKHSDTGAGISNIDSIMILKTVPLPVLESDSSKKLLALQIDNIRSGVVDEVKPIKVIELADDKDISMSPRQEETDESSNEIIGEPKEVVWKHFDECCDVTNNVQNTKRAEANFNLKTPDELRCSMQRLNMQLPVLEEVEDISTKRKKSPNKTRIKSPYENKLYVLEERKRKKLLEIREKREKKKMAINENCKIIKHRYGKGAFMPQPSSSVTKLSITNKSFYNSIYGQTVNADNKITRKGKGAKGDGFCTLDLQTGEEDVKRSKSLLTPERNNQKYINRSYYLDDAETEVMYMQMRRNSITEEAREPSTPSTSPLSNDTPDNLALLQKFINHSATDFSAIDTLSSSQPNAIFEDELLTTNCEDKNQSHISIKSTNFTVPTNTPKVETDKANKDNVPPSLQCRQSIEKVYNLIKVLSKTDTYREIQTKKSKLDIHNMKLDVRVGLSIQNSDSGTSIKHQLTSSNPSSFSFDKPNYDKSNIEGAAKKSPVRKVPQSISVVPKVIINSKTQTGRLEREKNKKECKRSLLEVPRNPLKAISQLLHEFDHVQKTTKNKSGQEIKSNRRSESTSEGKSGSRQFSRKYTEHLKNNDPLVSKTLVQNDRRARYSPGKESVKTTLNSSSVEEKCTDTGNKKKLTDFIDEVKELNGEAVRGPPKRSSRLNSLAQPKRSYVQAHHEEYQTRYGKNIVSDRLQKLASTPIQERNVGTASYKGRQRRGSETTTGANKCNTGPCLGAKSRRSASSSPDRMGKRSPVPTSLSYNYSNVTETTEPMKKKMVAVETYVKNHFGHVAPEREPSEEHVRKSRVPLLPTDFDLASMASSPAPDESTTLGKKLHSIIDSMVSHPPALSALMESNESSSKLEKDVEEMSIGTSSKCDEIVSCSDYPVDVFEDRNIVTAVESILNNKDDEIVGYDNYEKYEIDGLSSKNELQMLENALYNQLSSGNFQKRLRNKNLTLTPKQSLQQVVILQSGDSRSMVKTTLSQKFDISKADKLSQLAELPGLSKSCMGWEFTNFPIQIATVGYAFTKIQPVKSTSTPKFKAIVDIGTEGENRQFTCTAKSNKSLQCSQDSQIYQLQNSHSTIKCITKDEKDNTKSKKTFQQDIKKSSNENESQEINENKVEMSKAIMENDNNDNVGHTSSLDILVGLLNEIKKITTCQADMVNLSNNLDVDLEKKELEIILNKAVEQETFTHPALKKIVSRTTLQNLHQFGFQPSDYSITSCRDNILKIDKQISSSDLNLSYFNKHLTFDKEINVNIFEKQWVHRYTEVSQLLPIKVSHSTDVTDSLTKICNKSSIDLFKDCLTLETASVENLSLETFHQDCRKSASCMTCPNQFLVDFVKENNVEHNECKMTELVPKSNLYKNFTKRQPKESNITITEFDPLIKMKRDILVTVYSILVFTVFAALSFPQFAY